jgi:hypothetical protein
MKKPTLSTWVIQSPSRPRKIIKMTPDQVAEWYDVFKKENPYTTLENFQDALIVFWGLGK